MVKLTLVESNAEAEAVEAAKAVKAEKNRKKKVLAKVFLNLFSFRLEATDFEVESYDTIVYFIEHCGYSKKDIKICLLGLMVTLRTYLNEIEGDEEESKTMSRLLSCITVFYFAYYDNDEDELI